MWTKCYINTCRICIDYGDEEFKEKALKTAYKVANEIKNEKTKNIVLGNIEKLKEGKRDLFL